MKQTSILGHGASYFFEGLLADSLRYLGARCTLVPVWVVCYQPPCHVNPVRVVALRLLEVGVHNVGGLNVRS